MYSSNPVCGLVTEGKPYTYAELCTALGTVNLTGRMKETQIAEWAVYMQFAKKGRFFEIQKIYQNSELETQKYNYCMTKLVRVSLLEFLKPLIAAQVSEFPNSNDQTPGIISVERNNLLTLMGLANITFSDEAFKRKTESESEFIRTCRSRAIADIEAVCKELLKEKAVHSSEGFLIETEKYSKRSATTEEVVEIFNVYQEMLSVYKVKSEGEIRINENICSNFYEDVSDRLRDKLGITFHTKSYTFASSQFLIDRYMQSVDTYLLGAVERLQETNRKACLRARRTAQKAFGEFEENKDRFRAGSTLRSTERLNKDYRENYLDLQEELIAKYLELQEEEFETLPLSYKEF
jgi:hypothetical protein